MEEDIKMLEEIIKIKYKGKYIAVEKKHIQAIENLINRNKELEEENNKFRNGEIVTPKLESKTRRKIFNDFKNYIPKSKVKEKIEEYRKKRSELANGHFYDEPDTINQDRALFIAGETLKLLLEE